MYNRAEVIDQNFVKFVREGHLPKARTHLSLSDVRLKPSELVDLFETQAMSRILDLRARELKNNNLCFYTIGSSGHEGNAVFGKVFRLTDMAFLHYRSAAFMLQRSKKLPGSTPLYDNLLSFVASSEDPISGGRHKVFGSYELLVPPQTSTIASHLPKAMGAALSIARTRDLKLQGTMPYDSVVTCSFGDASANHSTAVGAINAASWTAFQNIPLPLVWICEDNGIGISVSTPNGWIENAFGARPATKYITCDGLHLLDLFTKTVEAENWARVQRKPVFLHMRTVRLLGHAGSDMETSYSTLEQIEQTEFNDPLLHSARILIENGVMSADDVVQVYQKVRERVNHISDYVVHRPKLNTPDEVRASLVQSQHPRKAPPVVTDTQARAQAFGKDWEKLAQPQHLAKLINWGLTDILLRYNNTVIFGEDVAQKGGVYNVTDGLYKRFGARRIFNSLLDEQSILGTAIGFAHNGFVPIPEIQFLAYVHNAEDQIRGEAATLMFFSSGHFTNPMVIRIAGLPYQKGFGGHFHNDNSLAVFRDIPGVIVAVPSNGLDAVKMLRTCVREAHENGRVCVFIEPIALYMTRDLHKEGDKEWMFQYPEPDEEIAIGEFAVQGEGQELAIITYGNGYYYSRQAAKVLEEKSGVKSRIIDLRWIAPINAGRLSEAVSDCQNILIVDECRKTGSLSEGLVAMLVEHLKSLPPIKVIAADDCFIPLGVAAAAGLPKRDEIVKAAQELMGTRR